MSRLPWAPKTFSVFISNTANDADRINARDVTADDSDVLNGGKDGAAGDAYIWPDHVKRVMRLGTLRLLLKFISLQNGTVKWP